MSARRLKTGGRIDRAKVLPFTWDGRGMTGHPGDSLASALMANGERVVGRSFKYHRPRGIMSAGVEESGAIVTIGDGARRDANVRATTQALYDGLAAFGQNARPNVRFDIGAINNVFGRFLAAGFYYKTFMGWPPFEWGQGTGMWMRYEKLIRKAAGMGAASRLPDPDHYEHAHDFCDLLVVGAGPAGLAAAQAAGQAGLDVVLVEQDGELGGNYLNGSREAGDAQLTAAVNALTPSNVRIMTRTTAFGLYDSGVAGLVERVTDHLADTPASLPRQRCWTLRAKHIILATGALERHIAFGDNDRPGVMTAAAARSYLNRYAVLPGEKIVVATNNDSAYRVAAELAGAGAEVLLLDARSQVAGDVAEDIERHAVELQLDTAPLRARGARGVSAIDTAQADGTGWRTKTTERCDLVLVSGGWSPVVHLLSHRGVKPVWDDTQACFIPDRCAEPITMAGAAAGVWRTQACIDSGVAAAQSAVAAVGTNSGGGPLPSPGGWDNPIRPLYEVRVPKRKLKSFVDLTNDVTSEDVRLAHREGFVSVEHLKRYTTLGMSTDQGKMGNIVGMALMAEAQGKAIASVGTTTFRPPYTPVSLGALRGRAVGEHFKPLRRTPMHDWNLANGATMTEAGLWQRPWYFARPGETISEAYVREALTARRSVALCDVTSLGKIAVQGPDATELLNRVYTNAFAKLAIGKARYGIMLRDDGIVLDDGTTWRLGPDEYFMTTTTAHAAKVMVWLEELLQVRWPDLRVHLTSVSEQWAGVAVAGPKSRDVLSVCVRAPAAVTHEALPFMGVTETQLNNEVTCRIARISFSGEMAYEIYVPADYGPALMDELWNAAKPLDGCHYGTEALGALRIEKGHVTGAELDGRVTIDDAGLGKMASTKKSYIGSALRQRPELMRDDRPRLVGIFPVNRHETFNAGSLLCAKGQVSGLGEGWITAVTHSPELGHWIGLGFANGGHQHWQGQVVIAADPVRKGNIEVELVSPHMVDPSGERMHG